MNGQNILTYYFCNYVHKVILEYEKESYISSCNPPSYVFIRKEDGEITSGTESSGGREDSNSKLLFQHGNYRPLFNFQKPFYATSSYTCNSLFIKELTRSFVEN